VRRGSAANRPRFRTPRRVGPVLILLVVVLIAAGCAKYNTYYNAKKAFDNAEFVRDEAIRKHQDPPTPTGKQKTDYELAIQKSQKVLDEYPGHGLTDDALFLQAKSYHRLESYRQSIRNLDLLFTNFPQTEYLEESLYIAALNYLLIGGLDRSQEYLDRLSKLYPESKYQAETLKVSGDNAFALRDWEGAVESYEQYLALDAKIQERDRIGLKLARCFWELDDYGSAAEVLQEVGGTTVSAELGFRARLLRARVHVRMGDFEVAELLLGELRTEAPVYRSQGEVALAEAENLIAQGKGDEASPLLENMPPEWETPTVKAKAADMLGYLYMERGELDNAREKFQAALVKRDELEDYEATRRLSDHLKEYLAAENALPDASGERVARLQLLQANALLFGFDRPEDAAALYVAAGADTAADSTIAARALYGAYFTYDRFLDNPDSAAIFRTALIEKYPDSPQAFEVQAGEDSDLLGFLLAQREIAQAERFANLTEEERAALESEVDITAGLGATARDIQAGVRRRMVYLSRRPHIVFPPPQVALDAASQRQAAALQAFEAERNQRALADSLGTTILPGTSPEEIEGTQIPLEEKVAEEQLDPAQLEAARLEAEKKAEEEAKKKAEEAEEEKRKKERDKNWDMLR